MMSGGRGGGRGGNRRGLAQVCAAGVLWGSGGLVLTVLHERAGFGAMTVSAWRMISAAAALLGLVAVTGRGRELRSTMRREPRTTALVGVGTAAYQGLYFLSVLMVGVSVSTVVSLGLAPVLAALWEHLVARTRPTRREVGVLTAALVGLVLVSVTAAPGSATASQPALGLVLAVAAGVTYAATTVLGHTLAQRVDPVVLTTGATSVGAIALAPFLVVAAATSTPVLTGDPASLALLLYLGLATMALAYGLLYAGLRTIPGSSATLATLVEPLSAALLAVALLGERLPWPAWVGGALILAAVVALPPPDPHAPPSTEEST